METVGGDKSVVNYYHMLRTTGLEHGGCHMHYLP